MTTDQEDRDSYHGYSVDAEDQPQGDGESMADDRGLSEPLDEGYSPGERWSPGQGFGNTPREEATGESFDQRYAQEVHELDPYDEASGMSVDAIEGRGEPENDVTEVGDERTGRLVAPDEGSHQDVDGEEYAEDIGIDGAGASAEEAAMHTIERD